MRNKFRLIRLLSIANIPKHYRYATLGNYRKEKANQKQLQEAASYCQGMPDYSLTINGKVGVGKTRLALSIMRHFIDQGVEGLFYRMPKLLRTIKNGFDTSCPNDLVHRCCEVPFLIIDDLGCCRHTPWVDEVLDDIISERSSECLPTIVTSNLSQKELEGYLSGRMYSRLIKGGKLVPLTGDDKRPKNIKDIPAPEEEALWQAVDRLMSNDEITNQTEKYEDFIRIYSASLDRALEKKTPWQEFKDYYVDCQGQDIEVVRRAYTEYCGLSGEERPDINLKVVPGYSKGGAANV
ncbi:MAG: ATP-binding protein [Deltaproteobacteria bacterium]|nr:ATP-binding protein [Deltaproteobacteria bacterium]